MVTVTTNEFSHGFLETRPSLIREFPAVPSSAAGDAGIPQGKTVSFTKP
jgi:hypothetical protein